MGSNKNPLISVITSCYKSNPAYLRESLLSILNQTYGEFELLVSNNGVDFNLKDFITSFKDDRIKCIDNGGNIGPTASYDNLAHLAKGEYVAIQDHDDISLPHRLQEEKDVLESNLAIMSVSGVIHIFGGKREYDDGETMQPSRVREELLFWQPIKQPTFMKRKSLCKWYKYDPNYMIYDFEYWSRIRKEPHFICNSVLLKYRKSNLNTGNGRTKKIREEHAKIVRRNLATLGINAPIELCKALDPYDHHIFDKSILDVFVANREKLLKHISPKLYNRKLQELEHKTI